MPILHKSSKFETNAYYVIFPLLIGICIFFIIGILSYGSFSIFTLIMILIFLYALIISTESLLKLRYIEVTENYISVKTLNGRKNIEFKNIIYTYNLININGTSLIIWYTDEQTLKPKVILVRPEEKAPEAKAGFPIYSYGSSELNITKYIKEKASKENPNYLSIDNPRWFLFSISPTFKIM